MAMMRLIHTSRPCNNILLQWNKYSESHAEIQGKHVGPTSNWQLYAFASSAPTKVPKPGRSFFLSCGKAPLSRGAPSAAGAALLGEGSIDSTLPLAARR